MAWTWRTTPDGFVEVDRHGEATTCKEFASDAPQGTWERPLLPSAQIYLSKVKQVEQWADLAVPIATKHGVPIHWVLAFMYAEGGGDPEAELHEPDGSIGVGLMALTAKPNGFPAKFGITFEEAHLPEPNLRAGIEFMRKTMNQAPADDIVELASAYNCGYSIGKGPHRSTKSPWGLCEFCGRSGEPIRCCHIERVSRAANTFLMRLGESKLAPIGPIPGVPLMPAGWPGGGAAFILGLVGGWFVLKKWKNRY